MHKCKNKRLKTTFPHVKNRTAHITGQSVLFYNCLALATTKIDKTKLLLK